MLIINNAVLSRGNKILLQDASVSLYSKQKIGLIGYNGCGKSTLFALIQGAVALDHGEMHLQPQLRIAHLSQHLPDSELEALDFVLQGDEAHHRLMQRLHAAEHAKDGTAIVQCHDELSQSSGYAKKAKAASIMAGLGFEGSAQQQAVNAFSGGWRMRLSLARCLMKPADFLLLDEPTNHLDMEAILWLEKFLKQSPASVLLISHDRDFLDGFVSHILHLHNQCLTLYSGDYSAFEKTRAERLSLQQVTYEKQQQKIAHLMSFVTRFRAKASKAKQAQSRLNMINKIEQVAQAQFDSPFSFDFLPCPKMGNPLIRCDKMYAGYHNDSPVLKQINLMVKPGDRIALLGPNGMGKSTFIKTLIAQLPLLKGRLEHHSTARIGYYAQHQLDELDISLSPIETIQALNQRAQEQEIRNFLGGFDFCGSMAEQSAQHFSGGEKARLALAKLIWLSPNILLLDEPTNHLDLGMRSAIELALQNFSGALILISHDRHLLKSTVDEYYLVYQQSITPFKGDLDDYYQWLASLQKPTTESSNTTRPSTLDFKTKKQLSNQLKKLESRIELLQHKHQEAQEALAEPQLYNEAQSTALQRVQQQAAQLSDDLHSAEEQWMTIMHQLES